MVLDKLGRPFQGTIRYWIEDTYGSGESTTTLAVSCKVQNVRVDTGDRHKVLKDIGSPVACHLLKQIHEPKLHLEYIPQCDDTLIDDVIDRDPTTHALSSEAFCVGANIYMTADADNVSYYMVDGCKPSTVRVTGSKSTEYLVVVDFEAKSIVTSHIATGTTPTPLTGDYLAFNIAGEIRKTGGHVVNTDHIAFNTNSVEFTVTHKLTGYTDHDSLYKSYLVEGDMDVEGSVDITLDGGGANHIGEVLANTSFDLVLDMGLSGCPRITLPNCEWKNASTNQDTGGEAMMNSSPFTCKVPANCTIVTVVP
jgi:hypothetical protein